MRSAPSFRKFRSYGAGALLSNDLWGTSGPPGFGFAELDRTETELDRAETEFDRADSVPKLNNSISKLNNSISGGKSGPRN